MDPTTTPSTSSPAANRSDSSSPTIKRRSTSGGTHKIDSPEEENVMPDSTNHSNAEPTQPPPNIASSTTGSFECNICLDIAQDAVVSMCGHLFCWPCLHRWMETTETRLVCPVCKAAINKDKVIPLYGRGGDNSRDPRSKVPPRPAGHRVEPEANAGNGGIGPGLGVILGGLFGNMDIGGNSNFRMSVGIGAFPFGFLATAFNVGGGGGGSIGQVDGGNVRSHTPGHSTNISWNAEAETMSKLCLFVAIFFLIWLLIA